MLRAAALLLLIAFYTANADEIVQLELFEDSACSTEALSAKPYAYTGVCQPRSAFLPTSGSMHGFSKFTCTSYTGYVFPDCTSLDATQTMPPTSSSDEEEIVIPEPVTYQFACTKSLTSDYYYKFSCVAAQVVAIVNTGHGNCSNVVENDPKVDSYFRPCTNGINTNTADLKSSSDRFTRFPDNIMQHESWTSSRDCPEDVAPVIVNKTIDLCVNKEPAGDGSLQYRVLGNSALFGMQQNMFVTILVVVMALFAM